MAGVRKVRLLRWTRRRNRSGDLENPKPLASLLPPPGTIPEAGGGPVWTAG